MFPHDSLSQNPILEGPKQRHSYNTLTQHLSGEVGEVLISLLPQPVQVTEETLSDPSGTKALLRLGICIFLTFFLPCLQLQIERNWEKDFH